MLSFIQAGGFLMWPIILCSIIALGIAVERYWTLQYNRVVPEGLLHKTLSLRTPIEPQKLKALEKHSPLGKILAAGLQHSQSDIEVLSARVEDAGRHVVHDLEKYLSALGTIAAITPLLGLLGTVVGMIDVFSSIMLQGVGQAQALAGGIATALLTTAAGLMVAIPAMIVHRYFQRQIDTLSIALEQQATAFVEAMRLSRGKRSASLEAA